MSSVAAASLASEDRRKLWFEVLTFLVISWLPGTFYSAMSYLDIEQRASLNSFLSYVGLDLLSVAGFMPICLLIAWKREGSLKPFGLQGTKFPIFVISMFGILLAQPLVTSSMSFLERWLAFGEYFHERFRLVHFFPTAHGGLEISLLALNCFMIGFNEEFRYRGYLLKRFDQLFGNEYLSTICVSALWASGHLYQGPFSALNVFVIGLVIAYSVRLSKSIWPAIVAHAVWDFFVSLPR